MCVEALIWAAALIGCTYKEINVVLFCIIACTNGQVLGHDSQVRVFSAEHIKGLEFEAVIFMGVDQIKRNYSVDYIYGSMYVGISRAAYHLLFLESKVKSSLGEYISDFFHVM